MTLVITEPMALRALEAAVAAKGAGYLYQPQGPDYITCAYAHAEKGKLTPGCLVGWALHYLGVSLDVMRAAGNRSSIGRLAQSLERDGIRILPAALNVFRAAQGVQDSVLRYDCDPLVGLDASWGAALGAARTIARYQAHDAQRAAAKSAFTATSPSIESAVAQLIAYVHTHTPDHAHAESELTPA
jgi:hypothetical protein